MAPTYFLILFLLPLALSEWEYETTLGFLHKAGKVEIVDGENVTNLCIQTTLLDSDPATELTKADTNLKLLKDNKLFEAEKTNKNVKFVVKDLESLIYQFSQINLDIKSLEEYKGKNDDFTGHHCDVTHTVPAPPLSDQISRLAEIIENTWESVENTAQKDNPDADDKASVLETIGTDTKILSNSLLSVYETLEDIYQIHESLLQGEISEQLAVYIDTSVTELKRAKKDKMSLSDCNMGETGFYCVVQVLQRESGEEGFYLEPVPFEFQDQIFSINLKGITDNSESYFATTCEITQFQGTCLKEHFSTNPCLNAINREELEQIRENCEFFKIRPGDFFVSGTYDGGLVVGPANDELIAFVDESERLLDFPFEVCSSGTLTLSNRQNTQTFPIVCDGQKIKKFKYNETELEKILGNTFNFGDFLPDDIGDLLNIINLLGNAVTLPIVVIFVYQLLKNNCKCCKSRRTGKLKFRFGRGKRRARDRASAPRGEDIEMQERELFTCDARNKSKHRVASRHRREL